MKLGAHGSNRRTSAPRAPSSDHDKINFYCRISIFMKLRAHGPNRRTSAPRAQIMRKSIFTAESQFSLNWVLTAQIDPQALPELREHFYGRDFHENMLTAENRFLLPEPNF